MKLAQNNFEQQYSKLMLEDFKQSINTEIKAVLNT